MSDIWKGVTWNENGELMADIYSTPPEEDGTDNTPKHTYKAINCGGDCGICAAISSKL